VYKIVKDKVNDIPKTYSSDLSRIVLKLLNKNEQARPYIREVMMDPFIKKTMQEFVETHGMEMKTEPIPIKLTMTHGEIKKDPRLG